MDRKEKAPERAEGGELRDTEVSFLQAASVNLERYKQKLEEMGFSGRVKTWSLFSVFSPDDKVFLVLYTILVMTMPFLLVSVFNFLWCG